MEGDWKAPKQSDIKVDTRIVGMMTKVYIAGPLSNHWPHMKKLNIENAINAMKELVKLGFAPLCPHLSAFVDPNDELGYDKWIDIDLEWLKYADCILRLPGASKGADTECTHAELHKIPIFYSIEDIVEWRANDR